MYINVFIICDTIEALENEKVVKASFSSSFVKKKRSSSPFPITPFHVPPHCLVSEYTICVKLM